jgi:osmotically-inducible protein OsmY
MIDKAELEQALSEVAGVNAAVEIEGDRLVVTGMVLTAGEREAAMDILRSLAPSMEIEDNLEISSMVPDRIEDLDLEEADVGGFQGSEPGTADSEALEPGDLTDQATLHDAQGAAGPSGTRVDDQTEGGDRVYVPPTDPVRDSQGEFIGGFQTDSMERDAGLLQATSGGPADEAIAEVVRQELLQDSLTTALELEVSSENGVVTLRGTVDDIEDAENAVAVAARQASVVDVNDELEVRNV